MSDFVEGEINGTEFCKCFWELYQTNSDKAYSILESIEKVKLFDVQPDRSGGLLWPLADLILSCDYYEDILEGFSIMLDILLKKQ